MNDTQAEACRLHRAGLPITLCSPATKKPLGDGWNAESNGRGWQKKRWTIREINEAFRMRGQLNVGIRFGPESCLIDMETDSPAGEAALVELFGGCPPPVTPTFKSRRGTHRIYRWNSELAMIGKGVVRFKELEIHIGAGGKAAHALVPPSVTDGVERKWVVPPDDCAYASLPDAVVQKLLAQEHARSIVADDTLAHSTHSTLHVSSVSSVCIGISDDETRRAVQAAITATLPTGEGFRNRCIFAFARRLKAIPELATASFEVLRPYVEWWHELALPKIKTKAFEETWYDFRVAWQSVRSPDGSGPIDEIYARALSGTLPSCGYTYEHDKVRALVSLCCEMQRVAGDGSFFLACRTAGRLLGVPHAQAARWLRMLSLDGILSITNRGTLHRANEYRYHE